MLLRRVPRHTLRARESPVLPRLPDHGDDRFYLRKRSRGFPELHNPATATGAGPVQYDHGTEQIGPESEHGVLDPTVQDKPVRRIDGPKFPREALE